MRQYDFIPVQKAALLPLIPTRFKSKIAHTHSYPIGAEAISKALAGVPQIADLELTFWDYQFQPLATSYKVLEVAYRKLGSFHSASKDMIERGYLEAKWQITVKPVPRRQRQLVQAQLLERGLPFMKDWLLKNVVDGRRGRSGLSFSYNEETKVLGHEIATSLEPERV